MNTRKRDGFNKMIEDALDGKIQLIITKSVSRFARNTLDCLQTIRALKAKGVEVYFEEQGIWTFDGKGELLITIMSSIAQEESRNLSDNIRWGKRKSMSDGNFGLPYKNFLGYTKDKSGVLQVVEEEAAIVREIYRLYMQGFSYASIAKKLTADGILTPTRKEVWTTATVRNILKNETYRGSKYLQKQYVTDYLTKSKKRNEGELMSWYVEKSHTPIIPPEEWDMVQAEILRRRSLKRPITCHSPFATRVVCGECGGFFGSKVWNSTSPQHRRIVWQCNNRYVKGGGGRQCETPHVTEKKLSDGFVAAFNELLAEREDFIKDCLALRDKLADMNEVDAELAELERELDICEELTRKAIAENASRVLDQDEWNARNDAYLARYNAAKERIAELEQTKTMRQYEGKTVDGFVKKLRAHAKAIAEFDVDLWAAVIDRVVVDEDGGLTYVFKGGTAIKA